MTGITEAAPKDVSCTAIAIGACVEAIYELWELDDRERLGQCYGLVMAIERLNDNLKD